MMHDSAMSLTSLLGILICLYCLNKQKRPRPEVIKLFSCSTQLRLKFKSHKYEHMKKFGIFQA